jgi:hypothetical protein
MVTAAEFRKLSLALPEVEEKSHFEQPDFRVRNKIFSDMSPDGSRGTLKMTPDMQCMLLDAAPETFSPAAGAWGRAGWTHVELARIERAALADVLREAWRLVAPKRLVAAHSGREALPGMRRTAARTTASAAKTAPPRETFSAKSERARKTAAAAKTAPARKTASSAKTAPTRKTTSSAKTAPARKTTSNAKTAPTRKTTSSAKSAPARSIRARANALRAQTRLRERKLR